MLQFLMTLIHPTTKKDERGASAVEYGLLVAGIAAVVIVAVFALGNTVSSSFSNTGTSISNGGGAGGGEEEGE
jgi:pilus assembly protein Flp/PilA